MAVSQIHGARQIKSATITDAQIAAGAAIALSKLANLVLRADGGQALTADLPFGGFKGTGVADPTAAQDIATKAYVDSVAAGLDPKASVRVATTANGALGTAYANGQTVDGVVLATNDRIAIKDQTTGSENGLYKVNASGAPTRTTDADVNAEVTGGMFFFVEEGTVNADTGWVLANNGAIVLGTTALVFTQFSSAGTILGGNGLTKTGNSIDVVSGNSAIVSNANDITLTLAANSLLDITSGLRLARGTSGQMIVVNGSGDPVMVTMSGEATMAAGGAITLATTITRNSSFITRETPTGLVDGANTTYTLANTPIAGSEEVYLNGLLQEPGAGNDYTISGATITYLTAPVSGDKIRINYRK